MTSKPISATASRRLAAVRKVPLVTCAGLGVDGGALGAREELVPAAEQRALAVGVRRVGTLDGDQLAQRVAVQHRRPSAGSCSDREPGLRRAGRCRRRPRSRPGRRRASADVASSVGEHPLEQQPALGEHQLDVDAGRDLEPGVVLPGADRVGPGLDLEGPGARRRRASPRPRSGRGRRRAWSSAPASRRTPSGPVSTTSAPSLSCPSRNTVARHREAAHRRSPWPAVDRGRRRA